MRNVTLVNLTPHAINIYANQKITVIPVSGVVARLETVTATEPEIIQDMDGNKFEIVEDKKGGIIGLPEKKEGVLYIVSSIVRCSPEGLLRDDLISPDTSPNGAVRDEKGVILGVTRFQK